MSSRWACRNAASRGSAKSARVMCTAVKCGGSCFGGVTPVRARRCHRSVRRETKHYAIQETGLRRALPEVPSVRLQAAFDRETPERLAPPTAAAQPSGVTVIGRSIAAGTSVALIALGGAQHGARGRRGTEQGDRAGNGTLGHGLLRRIGEPGVVGRGRQARAGAGAGRWPVTRTLENRRVRSADAIAIAASVTEGALVDFETPPRGGRGRRPNAVDTFHTALNKGANPVFDDAEVRAGAGQAGRRPGYDGRGRLGLREGPEDDHRRRRQGDHQDIGGQAAVQSRVKSVRGDVQVRGRRRGLRGRHAGLGGVERRRWWARSR